MSISTHAVIESILAGESAATDYSAEVLAEACATLNSAYRQGNPIVGDATYDQVFIAGLASLAPDHAFLREVEAEVLDTNSPTVRHATPMLSTQKCYEVADIERYLDTCEREADKLGLMEFERLYMVQPKLDGLAANDSGERLVTRGNGLAGYDVTHVLERGMQVDGHRGQGRGEMVVDQAFFEANLGKGTPFDMDHPRNFVAGFVSADSVKAHHRLALMNGALRFVPFATLPKEVVTADELRAQWKALFVSLPERVPYLTDGIVVRVVHPDLMSALGATSNHERGVMAIKQKGEVATTTVTGIRLTTGRTGRVVPTLLIEPVELSGATLSKATAHTAANLVAKGLGAGAVVVIERAGQVVPRLVEVVTPAERVMEVTHCPSCDEPVQMEGEHAVCPNVLECPAQAENRLRHWFATLGTADLFGPKTVAKLVDNGCTDLASVYQLDAPSFEAMGFGPGQSENLVAQLSRSRREPVEDWRFLAALGIRHLGRGDARKLLQVLRLEALSSVTPEQIEAVAGFGTLTAKAIATTLTERWGEIEQLLSLGIPLERTGAAASAEKMTKSSGVLTNERVVFTGTMVHGKRSDMEAHARQLGAEVQSGVNGKTTLLVAGAKAGSKMAKAEANNTKAGRVVTRILSEDEYLSMIVETDAA